MYALIHVFTVYRYIHSFFFLSVFSYVCIYQLKVLSFLFAHSLCIQMHSFFCEHAFSIL